MMLGLRQPAAAFAETACCQREMLMKCKGNVNESGMDVVVAEGSFHAVGQQRPVIVAEGGGRQSVFIDEIAALRVVRPGVAHGGGVGDLWLETTMVPPSIFASAQTNF